MMTVENNVLKKISLPILLISLPLTVMDVLLPIFTIQLGLTPIQVTGLFSVFSLFLVAVRLITGHISDKAGRRPVFILGILFYLLSYFIYSKATNIPLIYAARSLQAIAAVFINISTYSMIADMNNKNNAHSFGKLGSYSEKGGLLGMALCFAILYDTSLVAGWRNLFLSCTIAAAVALIYSLLNIEETKTTDDRNKNIQTKFLLSSDKVKISTFNLTVRIFSSAVFSVFTLYLQKKFDLDLLSVALALIIPTTFIAFAPPYVGTISDNIGTKKATTISLTIMFVCMLLIPYSENIYLYSVIWTIYYVALTMLDITLSSIFIEGIAEEKRGTAIGQLSTAANIGNIIGPLVGGLAFQNIGLKAPYLISSFGFAVLLLFSFKNISAVKTRVN